MSFPFTVVRDKTNGVTVGVTDRTLEYIEGLREVTFEDVLGVLHTVYAHRDGPFQAVEDIVNAHRNGTLHTFADHETAIQVLRDKGDHKTADRVSALHTSGDSDEQDRHGGN